MTILSSGMLKKITWEDLPLILSWRNQSHIRIHMHNDTLIPWEEHVKWFHSLLNNPTAKTYLFLLHQNPVGVVNFQKINQLHKSCKWGFYIGETDTPKGTGTLLAYHALTQAFQQLEIRKICAEVFVSNQVSLKFHESIGFTKEGTLNQHVWKNDRFQDITLFALFADDWQQHQKNIINKLEKFNL